MYVATIKSRDGKLVIHGTVTWRSGDEFGFVPLGKRPHEEFWCKLDYWDLIEGELPLLRFSFSPS